MSETDLGIVHLELASRILLFGVALESEHGNGKTFRGESPRAPALLREFPSSVARNRSETYSARTVSTPRPLSPLAVSLLLARPGRRTGGDRQATGGKTPPSPPSPPPFILSPAQLSPPSSPPPSASPTRPDPPQTLDRRDGENGGRVRQRKRPRPQIGRAHV